MGDEKLLLSCSSSADKFVKLIETSFARLLVLFHVGLLIFRGFGVGKNIYVTLTLSSCVLLLIPEAIFTYTKTKASEWKWLCPCILLFTLSTLPQIWMLELDMMHTKRIQQDENKMSAVEVAIEIQRQANVDPDLCSLKSLLPEDDPLIEEISQQQAAYGGNKEQKRHPFVEDISQTWKKNAVVSLSSGGTLTSSSDDELKLMIDDDIDTVNLSGCYHLPVHKSKSSSVVINFNRVLFIKRIIFYTGNLNLDPDWVSIIPLETMDTNIIRPKDKDLKYSMKPKRKQDGCYVLDLETNIRSTTVFQYLEIAIKAPSADADLPVDMYICEIDLEYTDNYLASTGLTEYYQPPVIIKATPTIQEPLNTSSSRGDDNKVYSYYVKNAVQSLYDDDATTCSEFLTLKLLISEINAQYLHQKLLFETLQFVSPAKYEAGNQTWSGGSVDKVQVLRVVTHEGLLNETIILDNNSHKRAGLSLPAVLSFQQNVITIESITPRKPFMICELKLITQIAVASEDHYESINRVKRDDFLSRSDSVQRQRRSADQFEAKSTFMLLDPSEEKKAFYTLVLEQLTMVTLLFIRWVIPRPSSMTPEQLAGMLASWMGMMADQLNFLVLLDEEPIFAHSFFTYIVLFLFSVSQLQFSFVFSARRHSLPEAPKSIVNRLFGSFLWNSLCLLCLQDIPFMVTRCYCVFFLQVQNHTVAYFIGKNIIVVALQVYRMMWLITQERRSREEKEKENQCCNNGNIKMYQVPSAFNDDYTKRFPWIDDEIPSDMTMMNLHDASGLATQAASLQNSPLKSDHVAENGNEGSFEDIDKEVAGNEDFDEEEDDEVDQSSQKLI